MSVLWIIIVMSIYLLVMCSSHSRYICYVIFLIFLNLSIRHSQNIDIVNINIHVYEPEGLCCCAILPDLLPDCEAPRVYWRLGPRLDLKY